jgi:hypothetical protein
LQQLKVVCTALPVQTTFMQRMVLVCESVLEAPHHLKAPSCRNGGVTICHLVDVMLQTGLALKAAWAVYMKATPS